MDSTQKDNNETSQTAAKKVAELLSMPEHLAKVQTIRMNLVTKRSALDAQIKTVVQAQLEEARTALEMMSGSFDIVKGVRNNFKTIDELCRECQSLIGDYPLVKRVSTARSNVYATLREIGRMLAIPERAEEIRYLMEDDMNLLEVHDKVRELEKMHLRAIALAGENKEEVASVKLMYKSVVDIQQAFETKLWDIISKCIKIGKENPAVLVKALMIIEKEELLDQKVKEKIAAKQNENGALQGSEVASTTIPRGIKGWFQKCLETLRQSIALKFNALFTTLQSGDLETTIGDVNLIVDELTTVLDDVEPCFPEKYDIFNFHVQEYHKKFFGLLIGFANLNESGILPGHILMLVEWVMKDYTLQMGRLGISNESLQPPLLDAIDPLLGIYRNHVRNLMDEWCKRILDQDRESPPERVEGQYSTMAPVILFESVNTQVNVAKATKCDKIIVAVVEEVSESLLGFQANLSSLLRDHWTDLELEYIIALVNNNSRSYDHAQDLVDKISESLSEEYLQQLNMDPVLDGFHAVSKTAVTALVNGIFSDLDVAFEKLFLPGWYENKYMLEVAQHLDEEFGENIQPYIQESFMRRFVTECLERLVLRYLQELFNKKYKTLLPEAADKMMDDINVMKDMFGKYIRPQQVATILQTLEDIRELLDSEEEMLGLYFNGLLTKNPDITIDHVSWILNKRQDLDATKRKEGLANCKTVLEKRANSKEAPAGKGGIFSQIKVPK